MQSMAFVRFHKRPGQGRLSTSPITFGATNVMPMEAIVNFPHQVYLAESALQHARRGVVTYYYMASALKRSLSRKVVTS